MEKTMDKPWYYFLVEFLSANFYALAGALLSLFVTQKVGFWKGVISFSVGFLFAIVAPGIVNDFYPIGDSTRQGIAFASGMTGMNVTLGLIRLTVQWRNDPLSIGSDFINIIRGKYSEKIHSTEMSEAFKKKRLPGEVDGDSAKIETKTVEE